MTPRTLKVMWAFFSYGGNGGISSEVPDIRNWYAETLLKSSRDVRIDRDSFAHDIADTPITMGRNRAVVIGRQNQADVMVMVDSDQNPDMHLGSPGAKPFFESSFDFLYKHYDKGPCVIGAPYCGPPPEELVYVFKWARKGSMPARERDYCVDKYTRGEAAMMSGIQPVSGLPTGLIMYDMRIFDVTEPKDLTGPEDTPKGWFYYEWTDKYACAKASTEDGTATRDMSMIGSLKLGYNPVYCNWDAWAGHWKPYCVPKPNPIDVGMVASKFADAVRDNHSDRKKMVLVGQYAIKEGGLSEEFVANEVSRVDDSPIDVRHLECDPDFLFVNNSTYADRGVVTEIIQQYANGGKVVEVGSFVGQMAKLMVNAGAGLVSCVDTWEGSSNDLTGDISKLVDVKSVFDRNCKQEVDSGKIVPVQARSPEAALRFADRSLDMVYIDANHGYEEVKADISAWLPKVKSGGVLAGHDYEIRFSENGKIAFPGVKKAVEEVFGEDFVKPTAGSSVWYHVVK